MPGGMVSWPRLDLSAISQALAALTKTSFSGSATSCCGAGRERGSSTRNQSNACVSSRRFNVCLEERLHVLRERGLEVVGNVDQSDAITVAMAILQRMLL